MADSLLMAADTRNIEWKNSLLLATLLTPKLSLSALRYDAAAKRNPSEERPYLIAACAVISQRLTAGHLER